ncbi:MAG TPA: hypothetical protein VJ953_02545 [Saprospiraceae bacterium]|nr:hypothetical protein [Saprospiraceae bacterium]
MPGTEKTSAKKFGTFLGVFLPSLLTILGLIMYLRFGWIVANLGLGLTIVIVLVANVITFISALSAASIATNINVGVGGVYYLVSRSFGLETGGAIGVAFYISRTLSVTFYAFGLAEAILLFWPVASWGPMPAYVVPLLTALIIISITLLAGRSADLALKTQVPILILVTLSILSLIIGISMGEWRMPEWEPTYRSAEGFWVVFAVFFPGVTGFLAGIAMSGDLKDPGRAIPRGTLASVVVGTLVYILVPVFLAVSADLNYEEMANPDFGLQTWSKVALFGGLFIYPAAWGAILSSAIGSVLSGPRVLQSLSMDGLAPKFLSRLSKNGQPKVATYITGGIALAAVALGALNTVAKFVTVLFLTLYVVINLVAAIEKLVAEPSFRPKFNVPWYVSMFGAVSALFVMYLISPLALVLALGLELLVYFYFKRRALEQQWGDVNAGLWVQVARFALLRLSHRKLSSRNWRPQLLVFVKDIPDRIELVRLAAALGQNRGLLSISKMVYEDDVESLSHLEDIRLQMKEDLSKYGLEAFCEVNAVQSMHLGILNIARGHGIAGLKTNTVIFGWSRTVEGQVQQLKTIRRLSLIRKNILLVRFNDHTTWAQKDHQQIDIWWSGHENNGDLMLILAFMLTLNREWQNAQINIRAVVETEQEQAILTEGIGHSIKQARIPASIEVILREGLRFPEILARESKEADLAILGLQVTKEGEEAVHAQKLEEISKVAKTVIFMQNNSVGETLPILLKVEE